MEFINVPIFMFGFLWAGFHIVMGISSSALSAIEKKFGSQGLALLCTTLLPMAFLILGLFTNYWSLLAVFALYALRGVRTPFSYIHLNRLVSSNIRATVLSVQSFAFRIIFAITAPIVGYISTAQGLSTAFIATAIVYLVLGLHAYVECVRAKPFQE